VLAAARRALSIKGFTAVGNFWRSTDEVEDSTGKVEYIAYTDKAVAISTSESGKYNDTSTVTGAYICCPHAIKRPDAEPEYWFLVDANIDAKVQPMSMKAVTDTKPGCTSCGSKKRCVPSMIHEKEANTSTHPLA
jgi:hypothetical protein